MQIASTLLSYGAETNIVTKQGVTPLHLASQEGHTDMVTLLLDKGANIHMSTKVFQFGLLLSRRVFWVNINRNQSKTIWNKKGACIGDKQGYLIEFKGSKGVKPYEGLENQKEVRGKAHRLCLEGCLVVSWLFRQVGILFLSLCACSLCFSMSVTREAILSLPRVSITTVQAAVQIAIEPAGPTSRFQRERRLGCFIWGPIQTLASKLSFCACDPSHSQRGWASEAPVDQ